MNASSAQNTAAPAKEGGGFLRFLAVLLSTGAGVGVGFAAHQFAPPFPTAEPVAPVASAPASAAVSATASASASAAPTSSATPPEPPAEKPSVCMKGVFADKTFADEPALEFVCDEANPVKGAARLKEAIVNAGNGKTTAGMKEWAMLGFYELATYATLRGRCCPGEPTFDAPEPPEKCDAMKTVLASVAKASKPTASDDDSAAATKAFAESVKCHVRAKFTKSLGGYPAPTGGEGTAYEKFLARARGKSATDEPKKDEGVKKDEGTKKDEGAKAPAPEKPAPEKK